MEITTKDLKQPTTTNLLPSEAKTASADVKKDRQAEVRADDDSINLSKESLELSKSATLESAARPATIDNADKARKAVAQLVADVRNHPLLAKDSHSNVSRLNVAALLE